MEIINKQIILGLIFSAICFPCSASTTDVNPSENTSIEKNVNLRFYPSDSEVKPQCTGKSRHYLIVNKAGYYNSVFSMCTENGKFLNFWGWDDGKYTTFTTDMYAYWSELPENI